MGVKYYAEFTVKDDDDQPDEYRGQIELSGAVAADCGDSYLEDLIAKNFDLKASDVKLITWSLLH
jgi:hypothetical protein